MSTYSELTKTPEEVGLTSVPRQLDPLPPIDNPIVLTALTEEELERDESSDDVLTPVTEFGLIDLKAYWSAGMRGTLQESMVRKSVGQRVAHAAETLPPDFGFAIFDAYRSLALQRRLYAQTYGGESTPEPGFVSVPTENLLTPPAHATGAALDITLTYRGQALSLGTEFDTFTERSSFHALEEEESVSRDLRRLLFFTLAPLGFTPYKLEWWHYEIGTCRWAAMTGLRPVYGQPLG